MSLNRKKKISRVLMVAFTDMITYRIRPRIILSLLQPDRNDAGEDVGRVWFVAYDATPRHTFRAAGVAAESAAAHGAAT